MAKSDVEAARAFVRLFLKDDLTKALAGVLDSAGKSLKSAGAGIAKAGVGITAVGTGMLAPIVAGVQAYMEMGGAAVDASARTGLSVEAISELGFAAQQTGADMGAVEIAIKKMSTGLADAATGSDSAKEKLAALGLTIADLQGLSPDEQFTKIGRAIAGIKDPTAKTAAAIDMFGKSGTQLLPMLGDMDALRKKARDLGIVMSTEDAQAADDLGDAWDSLKAQGKAVFFQIGAAVAGPLKEYAAKASELASKTIVWVQQNQGLILTIAKVGLAVMAAGTALTAIGGAIAGFGFVMTGAAAGLTALSAVVGAILSPFGLLTAAVIGGVAAWTQFTASGRAAVAWLIGAVGPMVDTVKASFGGIVEAIKGGDWRAAMEIAFAGLQVVAAQGVAALRELVGDALGNIVGQLAGGDFAGAWGSTLDGLSLLWESFAQGVVNVFTGAAESIIQAWLKATTWITDKIFEMAQQEGPIGTAMAKILGVDLRKMQEQNDQRAFEGKRQSILLMEDQLTEAKASGDAEKVKDLENRLKVARDQLGTGQYGAAQTGGPKLFEDAKMAARAALDVQIAGARAALDQARKNATARQGEAAQKFVGGNQATGGKLDEAATAAQARLDALLAQQAVAGGPVPLAGPGVKGGPGSPEPVGMAGPTGAPSNLITFSAAAAAASGFAGATTGPQERMASTMDRLLEAVNQQLALAEQGKGNFDRFNATLDRYLAAMSYT